MTYHLDATTDLTPQGDGVFAYAGGGAYLNFDTAFGGWVMALAVEAVNRTDGARGRIISLNAMFIDAIRDTPLTVTVTSLMKRPRTDFWRVSIAVPDAPSQVVFTADIITSLDRNGDLSFEQTRPEAPLPEDVKRARGSVAPGWFDHIDQRWTVGRPFKISERPQSITWARDAEARPLDAKSLITLSDAIPPRTFFISEKPTFGSTISFSVSLFASEADYQDVGTDFVMIEGDSDVIRAGTYDQRGKLWSRSGRLLAISNQIAFYK